MPTYPQILMYYIATGATGALFTLRCRFMDFNYRGVLAERDQYIITLTANYETAVKKAENYIGAADVDKLDTSTAPELRTITRSEIDHSILRFGKYEDHTISEVAAMDRNYLIWCAENMISKTHSKTIELIRTEVADELKVIAECKAAEAIDAADRKQKEADRIANLQHVGSIGEKIIISVTLVGSHTFETGYGYQTLYFFETALNSNLMVWKTSTTFCKPNTIAKVKTWDGVTIETEKPVEKGEAITIKCTVKEHSEYKGKKQTVVTRVKWVADAKEQDNE